MHVSSEHITSWALLSLTSTAGPTSRVFLADVIPWINKASYVLYIAHTLCAMPRPSWCSEAVLCCRVHLLWLKNCQSWTRCGLDFARCVALYWWPFTIWTIMQHAATGHVVKFFIVNQFCHLKKHQITSLGWRYSVDLFTLSTRSIINCIPRAMCLLWLPMVNFLWDNSKA